MRKSLLAVAAGLILGTTASVAQAGQYDAMVGEWAWEGFTIEVTEPTGPDVIALIQLNDTNVHCRIDPEHPVTWGETAELMFDMKKVVFFDPETEKRIAPH